MDEGDGMNRRRFIATLAAGTGGVVCGANLDACLLVASVRPRLNVLWLIAEDLSPDLGCYGNELVHTPNIDRLAMEGVRFTNAFATAPVCSASRSAFMTGMYQTSIGAHQHRTTPKEPIQGGARLLTDYFRDAGYFTCNASGDDWGTPGKTDLNFTLDRPFDGVDWRQRPPGQPFFAQVNFNETHRGFARDPERPIDPNAVTLPLFYPDHPLARRDWADYLESVQILDRKVGGVLRRLEDDGLADTTIVFFFGDHGRAHVRGKQFLYDGGIHIPLIVREPGGESGIVSEAFVSAIDFGPTSLSMVGIEPPPGLQGQLFLGRGAETRDYVFAARDRCDETYDRIRCVRDRRFKYIRNYFPNQPYTQSNLYKIRQYPVLTLMQVLHARGELTREQARFLAPSRPAEELYDLGSDPQEMHNLAESPGHASVLEGMRQRLASWIAITGDRGETPEDPRVAARVYIDRHLPSHRRVMSQRGLPSDISPVDYLKWWETRLLDR